MHHHPRPLDACHPSQVALRTYVLSLSLSLGPSLVPIIASFVSRKTPPRALLRRLKQVLKSELRTDGFASAITLSVAGGVALQYVWRNLGEHVEPSHEHTPHTTPTPTNLFHRLRNALFSIHLTPSHKTFLSTLLTSTIGIILLQAGRQRRLRLKHTQPNSSRFPLASAADIDRTSYASPTLDLTLLLFVRAIDALVQSVVLAATPNDEHSDTKITGSGPNPSAEGRGTSDATRRRNAKQKQDVTSRIDAFVFWACSARCAIIYIASFISNSLLYHRIMWCFFYEPHRLPRSYVKWISTLANLDGRISETLRRIRAGEWTYGLGSPNHRHLLTNLATELGFPAIWGDPQTLPSHGSTANATWKALDISGRSGVGGIPCHIIHGKVVGIPSLYGSCTANAGYRAVLAFLEAIALYFPVHFLPTVLTRPRTLLQPDRAATLLFNALRSAAFLSTFVTSYWYTVCLTRTLVLARLLPFISHNFWDGPYGCVMAGCLACGGSIWIENPRRRGEMALYVLPRAIRACLPESWVRGSNKTALLLERFTFVLSLSYLLSAGIHQPETLRGLSHWTLAFITNGPNLKFWKRKNSADPLPEKSLESSSSSDSNTHEQDTP
ncbi:hypothetical protein BDN72DRAFT_890869 [Pluteus cervinus]|uniref:Uncharacterized protein n=1 Tax=Pluteus cervinus TaxID=181527 RepID=A0ACD3BG57_9AGAR|nr:hypothetical protein BDN72DRAFT_890869 [Pluteus cervinus]